MTTGEPRPPRFARWLLRRALDGAARSAILGDLDEEFARFAVPSLGARAARRWYRRQALTSIAACVRAKRDDVIGPGERVRVRSVLAIDRLGWTSDLQAAVRFCLRNPLLSSVVVVTLALAIGANVAVFAVVNAIYVKKLPIEVADRLVAVEAREGGGFSFDEYLAASGTSGLESVIADGRSVTTFDDGGTRQRVTFDMVTGNYFTALRPLQVAHGAAVVGRYFTGEDDRRDRPPVVVLSHRFWRERYRGDPSVLGRSVRVRRTFCTIVGVAPQGFAGTYPGFAPDFWLPLSQGPVVDENPAMLSLASSWLGLSAVLSTPSSFEPAQAALHATLRPPVTGADAAAEADAIVLTRIPHGHVLDTIGDSRLPLLGAFAALILLIACLNVSSLLASTIHARAKELAIRAALGAGRLRLMRQLLAEHLLLATIAGGGGAVLGTAMAAGLVTLVGSRWTPDDLDVRPDVLVLAFTALISLGCGLAFGLIPAARWSQVRVIETLQPTPAGMPRFFGSRGIWWLIPGQVALGTVLLMSAVLLVQTVRGLRSGIERLDPDRIWFADVTFERTPGSPAALLDRHARLAAQIETLPGIEAASFTTSRPLASTSRGPLAVEGLDVLPATRPMPFGPPPPPPPKGMQGRIGKLWIVSNAFVAPRFFDAMGLHIVAGRDFSDRDARGAPRVAIVNETLARRAFGATSPIGRRLSRSPAEHPTFDIEIVGVVQDLKSEQLRDEAPDAVFLPLAQMPDEDWAEPRPAGGSDAISLTLVARTSGAFTLTASDLYARAAGFDRAALVDRIRTFDDEAGQSLSQERLLAWFATVLGVVALALVMVGLYGMLASTVARGRREIGIRLALGARPGSLGGTVVVRSLGVVLAGLAAGVPLAFAFARSFAHVLYGVRSFEPVTAAGIAVVVLATAAAAAFVPARRAARVDPVVALRSE